MKIAIVRAEPKSVSERLAELDLSVALLHDVGRNWLLAFKNCSPNHPKTFPGFYAWGEAVCALRDRLVPQDWERSDGRNYPLTVHPNGSHCIAIATGDEGTGDPNKTPSNRVPKGPRTADVVAVNSGQADLFLDDPILVFASVIEQAAKERTTFIFLIHLDFIARELRMELSIPVSIVEGRIDSWQERILLPPLPLDGDRLNFEPEPGPSGGEMDIIVTRKQ